MGLLDPPAFLTALGGLFDATRSKGSLYLTIKRVKKLRGRKGEKASDERHCLVRARADKKKISTTVEEAQLDAFQAELAVVLGENMTGLMKEGEQRGKSKGKAKGGKGAAEAGAAGAAADAMEVDGGGGGGGGGASGGGAADKKKKKKRR